MLSNRHTHTDTQTHRPSTVTLAAHARRGLISVAWSVGLCQLFKEPLGHSMHLHFRVYINLSCWNKDNNSETAKRWNFDSWRSRFIKQLHPLAHAQFASWNSARRLSPKKGASDKNSHSGRYGPVRKHWVLDLVVHWLEGYAMDGTGA